MKRIKRIAKHLKRKKGESLVTHITAIVIFYVMMLLTLMGAGGIAFVIWNALPLPPVSYFEATMAVLSVSLILFLFADDY